MKRAENYKCNHLSLPKGALIGPLVIAGVTIDKKYEKKLVRLGVKDSKKLTPSKREELAALIEQHASNIIVLRVQPCKIDTYREQGINLDKIEAMKMAQIIDMSNGDKVFVDSLEQNSNKFRQLVLSYLQKKDANMVIENYLDESIPVVSAASIIAKVERDKTIEEIKSQVNFDFGVGYPHDKLTIEFVEKMIKENGKNLPPYIRRSWVTTQILQEKSWQKKLKDFIFKKEKEECKKHED
jgi:ribonuclease HII